MSNVSVNAVARLDDELDACEAADELIPTVGSCSPKIQESAIADANSFKPNRC